MVVSSATDVNEAVNVLVDSYGEQSGQEALKRALKAEKGMRTDDALFWVQVFRQLRSSTPDPVVTYSLLTKL